jgi:hypothetical protein
MLLLPEQLHSLASINNHPHCLPQSHPALSNCLFFFMHGGSTFFDSAFNQITARQRVLFLETPPNLIQ